MHCKIHWTVYIDQDILPVGYHGPTKVQSSSIRGSINWSTQLTLSIMRWWHPSSIEQSFSCEEPYSSSGCVSTSSLPDRLQWRICLLWCSEVLCTGDVQWVVSGFFIHGFPLNVTVLLLLFSLLTSVKFSSYLSTCKQFLYIVTIHSTV